MYSDEKLKYFRCMCSSIHARRDPLRPALHGFAAAFLHQKRGILQRRDQPIPSGYSPLENAFCLQFLDTKNPR
jgi:hypothetical protein